MKKGGGSEEEDKGDKIRRGGDERGNQAGWGKVRGRAGSYLNTWINMISMECIANMLYTVITIVGYFFKVKLFESIVSNSVVI